MKVALIRGPFATEWGVSPWEFLHTEGAVKVTLVATPTAKKQLEKLKIEKIYLPRLDSIFCFRGYYPLRILFSRLGLPRNYLWGLRSVVRTHDIVHSSENYNAFTFMACVWSKIYQKKFVLWHGENVSYPFSSRNFITRAMKHFIIRNASAITSPATPSKRAVIHEGAQFHLVSVVGNCYSPKLFCADNQCNSDLRRRVKTWNKQYDTVVLFVGKVQEQKGIRYLLEALPMISHYNVGLIVAGRSSSDELTQLIESSPNCLFLGAVDRSSLPFLYRSADAFVFPSVTMRNNEEQFGLALVEAMAFGLPVVTTSVGSLGYLVRDGVEGLVVEERSSEGIAAAIKSLHTDVNKQRKLGRNASESAQKRFSPPVVGARLMEVYLRCVG